MSRHDAREARTLGLWTAAWLGGLLLAGLLWLGDLSLQWPVLLIPVLWALVAVRPRGGRRREVEPPGDLGHRTDTVERPALRPPDRDGWY
ncbi:hypothetical protein FHU33_4168 [Blastococcus colisei]|uniref:Uncharacterized protein n=1 Tax=Blastococcus colisei TaxID=1564162 RepID=A0A543P0B7_9ACTN|nr:hypothetical protein [Blastococcus colisei]TQN37515.1 hypothetical protein FHU33_4168 [Blastococcus colisei]